MSASRHFIASILRIGLSGAGAQAIVFLSLPILSRLYAPDSFGAWALIQSAAMLIGALATCRYELAVVLPRSSGEAASILGLGLILAFITSLATAFVMPWAASTLLTNAISPNLAMWAVPSLVFLNAANQLALSWCTRLAAFTWYGAAQLSLALFSGLLPALLSTVWPDALGLVVGTLMAHLLVAIGLWSWIAHKIHKSALWTSFSLTSMLQTGVTYRAYPLYMTPYTMISALRDRTVYFLLGSYAGASEVGLYSMAQRLANAPNSLVASALRPVFFQHIAQAQDRSHVPKLIQQVMTWLMVATIPPAIFFSFYPKEIVTLLFGDAWADSAVYVLILALPMLPLLLGNWMDRYFDVLGRQRLAFGMELSFSILAISAVATAFALGAGPRQAVLTQAGVMTLYFTAWIAVLFHVAGIGTALLKRLLILAAVIASITGCAIWLGAQYGGLKGALSILLLAWPLLLLLTHRGQINHWLSHSHQSSPPVL